MEELSPNEIEFLVALLASEESEVCELKTEFDAWCISGEKAQIALKG